MAPAPSRRLPATIALAMMLAAPAAFGSATSPLVLEHVTLEDGLTQSTVMDVIQDSQGFL